MKRNLLRKEGTKILLIALVYSLIFPVAAFALPKGAQVVSGTADISVPNTNNMNISQATGKAIINWRQFSIANSETVRFLQPGASSIAFNRVVGIDPSLIYGQLLANGRVWLINTNGIMVGPTGRINVNSFVASTLNLADDDFLSGNYTFAQNLGTSLASIVNQGSITAAQGGSVSLLAPGVSNQGRIVASLGKVYIGSGEQATLSFAGNELINFAVDKSVDLPVVGPDGQPLEESILNTGTISADGGEVILSAKTAYDAIKSVVNNTGIIEAKTLQNTNGVIKLDGGDRGIVYNSGTLDVSGENEGETGGTVQVTGEKVGLVHYSKIKAFGVSGGGKVFIGGGYQGKNPSIRNGRITYVGKDATIEADAIEDGDGGEVIVWADEIARFYGNITARGGSIGGDGGFVEVSGKDHLWLGGSVDTSAINGKAGTFLIDPAFINIADAALGSGTLDDELAPDGTILWSDPDDPDPPVPPATSNTVSTGQLEDIGATTNIILEAEGLITIGDIGGPGLIDLNTGTGNSITLRSTTSDGITFIDATDEIQTNGGAIVLEALGTGSLTNIGDLTSGGGNITLRTDNALQMNGDISIGSGTLTVDIGSASTQGASSQISGTTGNWIKDGTGTLTLNGTTSYSGTLTVTVDNGTLALGASDRLDNSSAVVVDGGTFDIGANSDTIGSLTLTNGNITGTTGTLTSNTAYDVQNGTISAILGGSANLNKSTAGTVTLSGTNSYTGMTTVSVGTLQLSGGSALANTGAVTVSASGTLDLNSTSETIGSLAGDGDVTLGTGTLIVGDNSSTAFFGQISGINGNLTKVGTGTLTLSGTNIYTGTTAVNGGTLQLSGGSALADTGAVTVAALGTFDLNGSSETIGSLAGDGSVTLGTTGTLEVGDNSSTAFSGQISGTTGNLTKVGSGTLTLSGSNAYTGTTTVNGGTLALGASDVLADSSAVDVNGGVFDIGINSDTINSLTLTNGSITGTGTLASSTAYDVQNGTISAILDGSIGLVKSTGGTVTLSGTNIYTGTTAVNGGTLQLSGGSALLDTGAVTVAALGTGTLDLNGTSETIGSLAGDGDVTLGSGTLTVGGTSTTVFSGQIGGTNGNLIKDGTGTLTLSGTNAYTGTTTVNGGTLALGASNVLADSSAVDVNGGVFDIGINSDTINSLTLTNGSITGTTGILTSSSAYDVRDGIISAILGGSLGLNKSTGGTVTLSGTNIYTGTTTITGGTLVLGGSNVLADASAVDVSGGTLDIGASSDTIDSLTLTNGSINGTGTITSSSAYDVQNGTISAILDGNVGLNKSTAGTVTLAGANTYTGTTTVSNGTLSVTNSSGLGNTAAGTIVVSGATLDINGSAVGSEPVSLNGLGVGGVGALTGTGTASLSGNVTLMSDSRIGIAGAGSLTLQGALNGNNLNLNVIGGGGNIVFAGAANNLNDLNIANASSVTVNNTINADAVSIVNGGNIDINGNVTANSNFTCSGTLFDNRGSSVTSGNISLSTTGNMNLGMVDAGGGLVNLNAIGDINYGTFKGFQGTVNARTIGLTSPVTADVSILFLTLTGKNNEDVSGIIIPGPSLTQPPPEGNISAPGDVIFQGQFTYISEVLAEITGALASLATISGEQEKLDEWLRQAAGGKAFMTPPLDVYIDMEEEKMEELDEDEELKELDEEASLFRPDLMNVGHWIDTPTLLNNHNGIQIKPGLSYVPQGRSDKVAHDKG